MRSPNGYGMFVMGANNLVAGNVISGNTNIGISVAEGATATTLQGNRIGTTSAATGGGPLPNGSHGVFLDGAGTTVGGTADADANIIANNGQSGVRVNSGTGHSVLRNSIFANAQLGIDLGPGGVTPNDTGDADSGANTLQNFPVLTASAGGVQGTLNSTPSAVFTIQFFGNAACDASGNGQGQTFLGASSITTDGSGDAAIPFFAVSPVQVVTATATSAGGDTSEFSACVTSLPPNGRPVANAGPDQNAYVGRLVTLDGNGNDPDDDDLTYAWSFTSRPSRQPGRAVERHAAFGDVHSGRCRDLHGPVGRRRWNGQQRP